ncbi:hypothetical protein Hrd1104_12960 [Halorhabdus sp. CBA1104]|uniref:hypothetical protein n=1 Tax=Halorhabdus sp. CBA1104 TaxID=1380432 RepID=UPI0012B411E8|nr:hypothetical protein [Halorhabdus sp. CBA1104]QGN08115.1 hypothetical protein Hrd1104_12960 [Halorhabdus sp. CBA1104]
MSGNGFGTLVLTDDHTDSSTPTDTHLQKTIVHETGHLLGAGRNNDSSRFGTDIASDEVCTGNMGHREQAGGIDDDTKPGLKTSAATNGWKIETINRTIDGEAVAYRWNGSVEADGDGVLWVSSDPLEVDSDDGGLTDYVEKEYTHTDPEEPVTYGITREQADMIETIEGDHAAYRFYFTAEDIGVPAELASNDVPVGKHGLNDATSDFDFVTDDSVGEYASRNREVFDRLTFTALDGTQRTDTWLSNTEELSEGARPWDPDTDDDGLTDGQELNGIRKATTGNTGGLVSFTKLRSQMQIYSKNRRSH